MPASHTAPRQGLQVLFTQSADTNVALHQRLVAAGATVQRLPLIQTEPLRPNASSQALLQRLSQFQALVFTSKHGVSAFFEHFFSAEARNLLPPIAVVGQGTALALATYGCAATWTNPGSTAHELAAYLRSGLLPADSHILAVLGSKAPDTLRQQLAPVATVHRLDVYHTAPTCATAAELIAALQRAQVVLLGSPSAVERALLLAPDALHQARHKLLSIGRITSAALLQHGLQATHEAARPDDEALWQAIQQMLPAQ